MKSRAADSPTPPADLGGACEGEQVDFRVLQKRCAHVLSGAGDEVHDPAGNPRLLADLHEMVGTQGTIRRRLQHHRVSADQRGHELPGRYGNGKVPGRDEGADTHRHPDGHGVLAGELRGDRPAGHPAPFPGGVVGHVDPLLHVAAGLPEDLPHLPGHLPGVLLLPADQDLADLVDVLGPPGSGSQAPPAVRLARRRRRQVHVLRHAVLEEADDLRVVGRIPVLEHPCPRRRRPTPR